LKFVADENVDAAIIQALQDQGHVVVGIAADHQGAADEAVLTLARDSNSILITSDKDFGDLVYRMGQASSGVILLRLAGLPRKMKGQIVAEFIRAHATEIPGSFSVLTPGLARIRRD
jgi:predicted nuclease of predicted toxin-antitoxin system